MVSCGKNNSCLRSVKRVTREKTISIHFKERGFQPCMDSDGTKLLNTI